MHGYAKKKKRKINQVDSEFGYGHSDLTLNMVLLTLLRSIWFIYEDTDLHAHYVCTIFWYNIDNTFPTPDGHVCLAYI